MPIGGHVTTATSPNILIQRFASIVRHFKTPSWKLDSLFNWWVGEGGNGGEGCVDCETTNDGRSKRDRKHVLLLWA